MPSEAVLPLAGYFSATGALNVYLAIAVALAGGILGAAVDYAIGYYVGNDVVYKHLGRFHVKRKDLDAFDAWFDRNAILAVFMSRLIPVVRTAMSFPAGFAKMPLKDFFAYSIAGTLIWDIVLVGFGFYALSASSAELILASVSVFVIFLYVVYALFMRHVRRHAR